MYRCRFKGAASSGPPAGLPTAPAAHPAIPRVQRLRERNHLEAEERLRGLRSSLTKASTEERARFENPLAKARDREVAA